MADIVAYLLPSGTAVVILIIFFCVYTGLRREKQFYTSNRIESYNTGSFPRHPQPAQGSADGAPETATPDTSTVVPLEMPELPEMQEMPELPIRQLIELRQLIKNSGPPCCDKCGHVSSPPSYDSVVKKDEASSEPPEETSCTANIVRDILPFPLDVETRELTSYERARYLLGLNISHPRPNLE